MPLRAPFWWYGSAACSPRRSRRSARSMGAWRKRKAAQIEPYRSRLPVICIGNFNVGGGGKTPTAIAVAEVLKGAGERPCFLTRGYGGKSEGPVLVDKGQSAAEVGDETLLLARACADRRLGGPRGRRQADRGHRRNRHHHG